jgi:hypothetical protein
VIVALSSEASAALLGALAGGLIAVVGQVVFGVFGTWRNRKAAAAIIYAELVSNLGNAGPALAGNGWPAAKPEAMRAAWDAYGARLVLPWHKPHDVAAVAAAYNRVDDVGWLSSTGALPHGTAHRPEYGEYLDDIYAGLYVLGHAAGYSDAELAARMIPVERVQRMLAERHKQARTTRRRS